MTPRWSVMATMADSSSANLRSASSLSDRRRASSASSGGCVSFRGVMLMALSNSSRGGFGRRGLVRRAVELLQAVAQLVARDAQEFGGARLVAAASFYGLAHERVLDLVEGDAVRWEVEAARARAVPTGRP